MFSDFYTCAAVMGFTAAQIGELSLWQFHVAVEGYIAANNPEDSQGLSQEEFDAIAADILALS